MTIDKPFQKEFTTVLRLAIYQIINENRQTMNRELSPNLNYLVNATFDCRGIFIE